MNHTEVIQALQSGALDDNLDSIIQAVRERRLANRPPITSFSVGDHVRIKKGVRPSYLVGATATVLRVYRSRVKLQFHEGQNVGRFHSPTTCPVSVLEVIQPVAATTFRKRQRRCLDA